MPDQSELLMTPDQVDATQRNAFFRRALTFLTESDIPVMVGGTYALERYTGMARQTKDIDVFVLPRDCRRALRILADAGYGTEMTHPEWLAKAFHEGFFMDIIFNSGNGLCPIDQLCLEHAPDDRVLGVPVKLLPAEEMIWSKVFIMERERYDGADVAHILLRRGKELDWKHLLLRMEPYWEVLLVHVMLFDFIYPGERACIPEEVREELMHKRRDFAPGEERLCRGPILSKTQYLADLELWGFHDVRVDLPVSKAA